MLKSATFLLAMACCALIAAEPATTRTFRGIRPDDLHGRQGLSNPERGYRTEMYASTLPGEEDVAFVLSPRDYRFYYGGRNFRHSYWQDQLDTLQYDGVRIIQCYVYLKHFPDRPLSPEKLADFENLMNELRHYGAKALLRFAYENSMECPVGPDAKTVLQHLETLKPLLRKHADVIYALEAGFIGAWGEWHSSVNRLSDDLPFTAELLHGILEALPPDRMTMVRVPRYKRQALKLPPFDGFEPLTAETAFSGSPAARIGYFNDGFLAGRDCGGTFPEPPYSQPGNPDFDQMTAESRFLPVDGELFWKDQGGEIDAMTAVTRLRDHHYTTFSLVHSYSRFEGEPYSIDRWQTAMLTPEELAAANLPVSDGYFEDSDGTPVPRSAYEYIRDHLGYRLELQQAAFPARIGRNETLEISFSLINRGFAPPINPRPVFLTLIDAAGRRFDFPVETDPRRWYPAEAGQPPTVHRASAALPLPESIAPGRCRLGLWLPDAAPSLRRRSDYAIRLANGDVTFLADTEGNGGVNLFGEFTVEPDQTPAAQ